MERLEIGMGRPGALAVVEGSAGATAGAGVAIGVSTYEDSRLTSCPAAARTAKAVAAALGPCLSRGATACVEPKTSQELFMALHGAVERARGGMFVLYFAGITIRRGDELLLTTSASVLDAKSACIAWSDVDDMLVNEKVERGLVILNAEGFAGVGWLGPRDARVFGVGSVRIHDPLVADQRIASYGDAVADALAKPAHELRAYLTDGELDVAALDRYLAARAPTPAGTDPLKPKRGEAPRHETYGRPAPSSIVLRSLREELTRSPASALVSTATGSRARLLALLALLAAVVAIGGAVLFWLLR